MNNSNNLFTQKLPKNVFNYFLYTFLLLSTAGLVLSIIAHILLLIKYPISNETSIWILHFSIFIVFIPAVFVAQKLKIGFLPKDYLRALFRGCPKWMKKLILVFIIYAIIHFIIFTVLTSGLFHAKPAYIPLSVFFRFFSSFWIACYYLSLTIFYSATKVKDIDKERRCPNGHIIHLYDAKYCDQCGAPLHHDNI